MKRCEQCGAEFKRPIKEAVWRYKARRYCTFECSAKARTGVPRQANRNNLADVFLNTTLQADGCLVWGGNRQPTGYGRVRFDGRAWLVHRLAYLVFGAPIPAGLQIDHLCRNRACVNVDHMELVSLQENVRRGVGVTVANSRKTHCPAGHPYEGDNLYVARSGGRQCRRCWQERRTRLAAALSVVCTAMEGEKR